MSCCLLACGTAEQVVVVTVKDRVSERNLDSAMVTLSVQAHGQGSRQVIQTLYTQDQGRVVLRYDQEEDAVYWVEAARRFFQPQVNQQGDAYLHEHRLEKGDSAIIELLLEPIPGPDPAFLSKIREEVPVDQVLVALRVNGWNFSLLPQLTWKDVPALLLAGSDTTLLTNYPSHPTSTYKPKQVRAGLVALWLVEAIRKMEMKQDDDMQHIVPPSRAPVLGTKEGNPTGMNSAAQVLQAQQAYQRWYEAVEASGSSKTRLSELRNIPLRGEGLSWM